MSKEVTLLTRHRDHHAFLTCGGLHAIFSHLLWPFVVVIVLATTPPAAADDFAKAKLAFDTRQFKTAARLLRPLAEKGDPRAQNLLGESYFRKHGVGINFDEALNWLERAVAQNYTPAFARLGITLLRLNGGRHERGLGLIRTASARGDPAAQVLLGWLHFQGIGGVPLDLERAKELFLKAANQKHKGGYLYLIYWHKSDQGKRPDFVEMLRWVIIGDRMGIGKAMEIFREMAIKHLTKAEIAEAKRRATAWLKTHGEKP